MASSARALTRGGFPWGLVGMLVLLGLAEGFVIRHEMDLKTGWFWEWTVIGRASRRIAAQCDVLCFGDSMVNHGIVPKLLEARLGRRAYNLAISGGQASSSYFLLRRALEAGARPRAVLVDFHPLLLNHGHEENTDRWPDLLTPRECFELAWTAGDARFFAKTMLARYLPSFRERQGLRTNIRAALIGQSASQRMEAQAWLRTWRINQGTSLFPKKPNLTLGDMDRWYKAAFCNPQWCAPYHAVFLRRFLKLAADHKLPVFWLIAPQHPEAQQRFAAGGTDERHDRLLYAALQRFGNVVIIDARRAGYDGSAFIDPGHLDRQGASVFTTDVGNIVKRILSQGSPPERWILMPTYKPLPLDAELEDINQSRIIVQREAQE